MINLRGTIQLLILLCLTSQVKLDLSDYKDVDDLLQMVVNNITASFNYVTPENNSAMLNVSSDEVRLYGNFDFIVVGGGAAGSVLANRLSEITDWNILLLEAGGDENDFSRIPVMQPYLVKSDFNWGYNLLNQTTPYGIKKNTTYPQGKVLGGSTVTNGAVYTRGNPEDYNNWQVPGWSFDEILPFFKKSENVNFTGYENKYHGTGGYWNVVHRPDFPGLHPILVDAFKDVGQKEVQDFNGHNQLGFSRMQYNFINGERLSSSRAFLDPAVKRRNNLNVTLNAFVTRLLFTTDKSSVIGVEFVKEGNKYVAMSIKETILSAGAAGSPKILLLSGIGPRTELQNLGIQSIRDLPVGKSAVDQICYAGIHLKTNFTFFNLTFEDQAKLYLNREMPWEGTPSYVSFFKLNDTQNSLRPDIELRLTVAVPSYNDYPTENKLKAYSTSFSHFNDIAVGFLLSNPKSRGSVSLKSSQPIDFPVIDTNYYGDPEKQDLEMMYQAMLYLEKLNQTKTFKENGMYVYYPNIPECDSLYTRLTEEWYKCTLQLQHCAGLHLVGTTKMGMSNQTTVVDPYLKVHGMKKLRVVDAGVMPNVISGHTAAPTMAIAEKAADIIKKEYNILDGNK